MELGMTGLGRLGTTIVRRLIRTDHRCMVYGLHAEVVQALTKEGAAGTTSLEDFAKKVKSLRAVRMMVPVQVMGAALFKRFSSRDKDDFADKMLSAFRYQCGGHEEKVSAKKRSA